MAEKLISIRIISPGGRIFEGDVSHAVLPGTVSPFAVYPMHAPMISSLTEGQVRCVMPDGKEELIAVTGGFAEISGDMITVCVE